MLRILLAFFIFVCAFKHSLRSLWSKCRLCFEASFNQILHSSQPLRGMLLTQLQTKKASHFRERLCDSDWIRTNGPHLRRMTLYPAELPNRLPPLQNIALGLQNKDNLSVFQRKFDSNWSTSILYHQISNHHARNCTTKNGGHIAQCANNRFLRKGFFGHDDFILICFLWAKHYF